MTMPVDAPAIRKEILRDKICQVLKGWILDGTLKPGDRIVEYVVARQLKVSRAPLREALWLLAQQGLVRLEAHHGAYVTRLSPDDIREIFEIRESLETLAARKICAALDPEKKKRLEAVLADLEAAARAKDMTRFSEADLRFHRVLWQLAENKHLEEVLGDLSARFFGYELIRDLPHSSAFRFDAMAAEHRKMVKAVLSGDVDAVDEVFRRVFRTFLDYVLARFEPSSGR